MTEDSKYIRERQVWDSVSKKWVKTGETYDVREVNVFDQDRMENDLPNDLVSISEAIAAMTDEEKQKFLVLLTGNPDGKLVGPGVSVDKLLIDLEKEEADEIQLSPKMKAWIEEADSQCPNPNCKCKKDSE